MNPNCWCSLFLFCLHHIIYSMKLEGFRSQLEASYLSIQTEGLWYNKTAFVDDNIYRLFSQGLSPVAKESTAATRVMEIIFT